MVARFRVWKTQHARYARTGRAAHALLRQLLRGRGRAVARLQAALAPAALCAAHLRQCLVALQRGHDYQVNKAACLQD